VGYSRETFASVEVILID